MIIVGIDPGKQGGIAYLKNGRVYAGDMPQGVADIQDLLQSLKREDDVFVFLEKVNAYVGDSSAPGKNINIAKLLEQASALQTVLKIEKIPFVLVAAISWQSAMNLVDRRRNKAPESVTEKKNRHKELAQKYYPHIKVTHKTSDALLILTFGKIKLDTDRKWITERVPKPVAAKLF